MVGDKSGLIAGFTGVGDKSGLIAGFTLVADKRRFIKTIMETQIL